MSLSRILMNVYAWGGLAITLVGIGYTLVYPPQSLRVDRDGVPHFTPQIEHPITETLNRFLTTLGEMGI